MKFDINKLFIIIVSLMFVYIVYQYYIINSIKEEQSKTIIEQKQLLDDIIRSQKSLVSKGDLEAISKTLDTKLDPIREDLKKFSAEIKGINTVVVSSPGYNGSYKSDVVIPKDPKEEVVDPTPILNNTQKLYLYEPFGLDKIKIGDVSFSSWRREPWDVNIYPKTYRIVNIIGSDENGKNYIYNKFFIEVNKKSYPIKISSSSYVEEFPESKFRFSPRVYLGISSNLYINDVSFDFIPNLSVFLFSYGRYVKTPDWIFGGLGIGYSLIKNSINLDLSIFGYNVGKHIPFMSNLYIGPDITVDTSKNYSIGLGVKAGL